MNVHEYQAKELFREFGVAVPEGFLATTPEEAERAAKELGTPVVVVKAQVHAGGRGKGGGVKLAKSPAEAKKAASEILGMTLHTPQTPPEGKLVRKVYVEAGSNIESELYLAILFDRAEEKFAIVASTEGGMEIEVVAEESPDKILTALVDPNVGLRDYQVRRSRLSAGLRQGSGRQVRALRARALQSLHVEGLLAGRDQPAGADRRGRSPCPRRQAELRRQRALSDTRTSQSFAIPEEEDERERAANEIDLAYVGLDGNIGCMVNGAGLAMATLDMINYCGGKPANFLDAGGGADKEKVKEAFKLILRDEHVTAILVNIFGGIVRCDLIAEGVVAAAAELGVEVPLVVRLQGTKAEEGSRDPRRHRISTSLRPKRSRTPASSPSPP